MNYFIRRYYAFLYYKHIVLHKGNRPLDYQFSISMYLIVYSACLLPLSFLIVKRFFLNYKSILSNITLTKVQIIGAVIILFVFLYVDIITKNVKYTDYKFNYNRDNLIYTIFEITPFILLLILVLVARNEF